jgi:NADH:ubiquinone oxidoreductase subunit E
MAQILAEHPSGDIRFAKLDEVMDAHDRSPDAIILFLQQAQQLFGYLRDDVIKYVALKTRTPLSQIYGVVTFYHFFSTIPKGKHTVTVCMGTACYVKGADRIFDRLSKEFKVGDGETTRDDMYTLCKARCVGACGLAPAVIVDEDVHAKMTPDKIMKVMKKYT